jgi:hypothetical protein
VEQKAAGAGLHGPVARIRVVRRAEDDRGHGPPVVLLGQGTFHGAADGGALGAHHPLVLGAAEQQPLGLGREVDVGAGLVAAADHVAAGTHRAPASQAGRLGRNHAQLRIERIARLSSAPVKLMNLCAQVR